jgi:PAS domain S-box-containing protein
LAKKNIQPNHSSIIKVFFTWGVLMMLSLTVVTVGFDIYNTYCNFNDRAKKIRQNYINEQKQIIKREVEHIIEMTNFQLARCEAIAKERVKARTYEAYGIIDNIYKQYRSSKSDVELKQLIKDALRPIRFNQGKGYYFIASLTGKCLLYPNRPSYEGKDNINLQDSRGVYIIKDELALLKTKDEGFTVGYWPKPGVKSQKDFKKITFIKKFAPFKWYVGTGIYVDDIEEQVKANMLANLNKIRFGKNGYMFAGDWTGTTLANGAQPQIIGKNIWDFEDSRGKKLSQAIIAASKKPAGGYVQYWWHKPDTGKEHQKVAYAKAIPQWKIFIATGLYTDDIVPVIATLQAELNRDMRERLLMIGLVFIGTIMFFAFLLVRLKKRLQKDFNLFVSFFDRAAYSDEQIELASVKFNEFYQLAGYANKMLKDKNLIQQKRLDEQEVHSITLYSIGDGVITTDLSGSITLINSMGEKLTGWKHDAAVNRPLNEVFNIVDEETGKPIAHYMDMVLAGKKLSNDSSRTVLIAKDGIEYHIASSATPIMNSKGQVCGGVFVFRDITEKQRIEEALFNARKMEAIGLLAGGIAHDFNNIMTGLFGNISLAKGALDKTNKAYEYLEIASDALDRAVDLTGQLLTFSKGGEPVKESVDMCAIISHSVKANLTGSNVRAILSLPGNLWHLSVDKGQISQALGNLITNAKQAMAGGGMLYVDAVNIKDFKDNSIQEISGNCLKITIRDEGTGIPVNHLKSIFDPYFTTKQAGSGLGLTIVFSIIAKHNGHISVDSQLGVGTTFTIYLPVEHSELAEAVLEVPADVTVKKAVHILVMDDKKMVRDVLNTMLNLSDCRIEFANTGEVAVKSYQAAMQNQDPFDIVIMDLLVPDGMGGEEAARKILEFDSEAKIIVSSGYSNNPVMANFEAYGFKGRLVKPFQMESLNDEINKLI